MLFSAGMTRKTRLGDFLGALRLEGNDLIRITFFNVGFSGAMTCLATGGLAFPARDVT